MEVVKPSLQLSWAQEQLVVEAKGKEEAVIAVLLCLSRLSRDILLAEHQLTVGTVAASLEAPYDAAEVFLHSLSDEQDAVQVIRHHLKRDYFYLRVVARYSPPFIAAPHYTAEKRAATLSYHRYHVHHALNIVMPHTAALHGRLLFACKGFLTFKYFALHILIRLGFFML